MNSTLFFGYINALSDEREKYFIEEVGGDKTTYRINIAGPYKMELSRIENLEIEENYLLDESWKPYNEEENNYIYTAEYGRIAISYLCTGSGAAITVKEYGGLDEAELQSLVNVLKVMQPVGWEEFVVRVGRF